MGYNERTLKWDGQGEDRDKVAMPAAFDPSRTGWTGIEGAVNAAPCEACVQPVLLPSLQQGPIVVIDSLRVQKIAGVRQLIEEVGGLLLLLPANSPAFSAIEETFSTVKAFLRPCKAAS